MTNLYYVVHKRLQDIDGIEETTGWKDITVYDIDTQSFQLVIICEFEAENTKSSEEEIATWLENNDWEEDYNLIEL